TADRSRWTSASVLPRVRRTSSGEREKAPVLNAPGPFATPPRRSNAPGSSGSSRPAGGPAPTTPGRAGSVRRPPPACRRQRSRSGPRRRSLRPFPTGAECVVGQERGAVVAERLPDGLGVGPVDLQPTAPVRDVSDPADRDPPEPLRVERIDVPLDTVGDLLRLRVGTAAGPDVAHLAAAVVPDVAVQAVDHDPLGLAGERGQRLREELVAAGCVQDLRGGLGLLLRRVDGEDTVVAVAAGRE